MRYFVRAALLPSGPARDVLLTERDGRWTSIEAGATAGDATRLDGTAVPGLANAHSHAFHRALRGRTHSGGGSFWTWRSAMYALSACLTPDSYLALARATYAEMALSGVTAVAEFHYLHHAAGGVRYDDLNEMAEALRQAAVDAGIRLTLLDTCYLAGGLTGTGHTEPSAEQRRFADADADDWAARVALLPGSDGMRVGTAIHSVRAVPEAALPTVVAAAAGGPLHVHLSEQQEENAACLQFYGRTPARVLGDAGVWTTYSTAVHATHLADGDVTLLGAAGATVCACPSTEQDLADGIGGFRALADAGCGLSVGSDQHAVTDLFVDTRAVEMHERLATGRRGRFTPAELLAAATNHASLGWDDAGVLEIGARADLVTVRTDSVRTAGVLPEQILFAATAADVDTVLVDGTAVVTGGRHRLGDVGRLLREAIEPLWSAS